MTTDQPPFVRHHRTAQALVCTVQEALEPQFIAKGMMSREEFTRAMSLMKEQLPKTLPLFARNCQSCAASFACPSGERVMPGVAFQPDGRRRDFATRLMFSVVLVKLPESIDPISGAVFPQILAPGLQATLSGLFYDKEWEALNRSALAIYNQIGSDRDQEVWARISGHDALGVLADTMFVRVMLRFKQFHLQRQNVTRRMMDLLKDKRFAFSGEMFDVLFDTMFSRLRSGLITELERAAVDMHYGEGTADSLMRIFDQFDRHRLEQSLPTQTIGGGKRAAKPMLAQRSMLGATPAAKRR